MNIFDPDLQKKGCVLFLAGLAVISGLLIGYFNVKSGGISAPKIIATENYKITNTPKIKAIVTTTPPLTITQSSTETTSPTYNSIIALTLQPSHTASPTYTSTSTSTSIRMLTPVAPTSTRSSTMVPVAPTRTRTATSTLFVPTYTPTPTLVNPTETPIPTTAIPSVTPTVPEPIVIESCNVDPSTVPVGTSVSITFIVHFSSHVPGYGFEAVVNGDYPEQSGCSGTDSDGDGMAYCVGSSGVLPESTTVYITLISDVGECVVDYSSR